MSFVFMMIYMLIGIALCPLILVAHMLEPMGPLALSLLAIEFFTLYMTNKASNQSALEF